LILIDLKFLVRYCSTSELAPFWKKNLTNIRLRIESLHFGKITLPVPWKYSLFSKIHCYARTASNVILFKVFRMGATNSFTVVTVED